MQSIDFLKHEAEINTKRHSNVWSSVTCFLLEVSENSSGVLRLRNASTSFCFYADAQLWKSIFLFVCLFAYKGSEFTLSWFYLGLFFFSHYF